MERSVVNNCGVNASAEGGAAAKNSHMQCAEPLLGMSIGEW